MPKLMQIAIALQMPARSLSINDGKGATGAKVRRFKEYRIDGAEK